MLIGLFFRSGFASRTAAGAAVAATGSAGALVEEER